MVGCKGGERTASCTEEVRDLGWSGHFLKTWSWFATVCQGCAWAMLWHSRQSLAKAGGGLSFFFLLSGFINIAAGFLLSAGQVWAQKCTLVAEFIRDEWWCSSSKISVRVHGVAYTSTVEHSIVFWKWRYIRGSVERSLLCKLSL